MCHLYCEPVASALRVRTFELVGDCCVHGIMHGKAARKEADFHNIYLRRILHGGADDGVEGFQYVCFEEYSTSVLMSSEIRFAFMTRLFDFSCSPNVGLNPSQRRSNARTPAEMPVLQLFSPITSRFKNAT